MTSKYQTSAGRWLYAAATAAVCLVTAIHLSAQGFSFFFLQPGFTQNEFGVTSNLLPQQSGPGYLGGVVVMQNGDVIAAECRTSGTRLHRFSAATTVIDPVTGLTVHPETIISSPAGGCGITLGLDGFIYSNMNNGTSGVARIDPATGAATTFGPPGNALGIAVDPVTGHLVYPDQGCRPAFVTPQPPTCNITEIDPVTHVVTNVLALDPHQIGYVDGVVFDPTGSYLFLTNRFPSKELVVIARSVGVANIVRRIPVPSDPVGIAFHASPQFVVTNNQDGTISRFDFPAGNFTLAPTVTTFASDGFRGDLVQVGPDACLYVTQNGVRNNDGDPVDNTNSLVQICGGFEPPPGITPNPPPASASLCGAVYEDTNGNGKPDAAEPGIPGVTITLAGHASDGTSISHTTTTANDGSYCFNDLVAGTYTIAEVQPAGYLDGQDTQGTPGNGTTGDDVFANITLADGVNGRDNDFGETRVVSRIAFVKKTNGSDNNAGIGPKVDVGSTVTWSYTVTNTGNVPLSTVAVTDDKLGAIAGCPTTLDVGASFTCSRKGKAVAGEQVNLGTATGRDPLGRTVSAQDPDRYFGLVPDANPPVCTIQSVKGPPFKTTMTFKDRGTGIATLEIWDDVNMKIVVPAFTAPSPGPIVVTGTRIDPKQSAWMTIKATDMSGNEMWCDPYATTVVRLRHEKGNQTFTNVSDADHIVTIENDSPGIRRIDIEVNGHTFTEKGLDDYDVRVVNIGSAMKRGAVNTITLVPRGKVGDSALVVIADH
jgi:hypothetical protein